MRHAQVAELGRPAQQGQARAAVGPADRVPADHRPARLELAGLRPGHQEAQHRADGHHRDGDLHRQPHRGVGEVLPGQDHPGHRGGHREHPDPGRHRREHRAVQRRGVVEVRRDPAGGLETDQSGLHHHRPADDLEAEAHDATPRHPGVQPQQRRAEGQERQGELERLVPDRGAVDDGVVDAGERDRAEEHKRVETGQHHQRRTDPPAGPHQRRGPGPARGLAQPRHDAVAGARRVPRLTGTPPTALRPGRRTKPAWRRPPSRVG